MSICWGLGLGCKWSSILPLLVCLSFELCSAVKKTSRGISAGRSLFFFFVVPLSVYSLCHLEYILRCGFIEFLCRQMENFSYFIHADCHDPSSSPWWSWILILKPLVIYRDTISAANGETFHSTLVLMGNPLLWWAGIPSILGLLLRGINEDLRLFILFSVVFELCFWGFAPRGGYIYYILNFTPVMMIAVSFHLQSLWGKGKWGRAIVCLFIAAAFLSFVFFSPLLYGIPVNAGDYGRFNLTGSWNL